MRKLVLIKILICFWIPASAQSNTDSSAHFYYSLLPPEKATVYYKRDSSFTGMLSEISDTSVVLFSLNAKNIERYSRVISITDIKKIKVQRHGVMLGVVYGGGTGFILGGIAGVVIDANSPGPNDASAAFTVGGFIGIIPFGIIGGLGGGIFTKHVFRINGNPEKTRKLAKALTRSQKVLSPGTRDIKYLL